MKVMELTRFGIENLKIVDADVPVPGSGQVLVKFGGASINYRDYQIVTGEFAPNQPLPIIPGSDGAGEVVGVGDSVARFTQGGIPDQHTLNRFGYINTSTRSQIRFYSKLL